MLWQNCSYALLYDCSQILSNLSKDANKYHSFYLNVYSQKNLKISSLNYLVLPI